MTDPRGHKLYKREMARCHWPTNDSQGTGGPTRQHNEEMYKKVMISVYKQGDATFRSAAVLSRELSLCIRPSSPRPPAGGPGSPELALDDLEARNTFPSAACSMSQESYDLTQQVSQPTSVPKNNFDPDEKR